MLRFRSGMSPTDVKHEPEPPFPKQHQEKPGIEAELPSEIFEPQSSQSRESDAVGAAGLVKEPIAPLQECLEWGGGRMPEEGQGLAKVAAVADTEDAALVNRRVEAVKRELTDAWKETSYNYVLNVEPEIFWRRGAPPKKPDLRVSESR